MWANAQHDGRPAEHHSPWIYWLSDTAATSESDAFRQETSGMATIARS